MEKIDQEKVIQSYKDKLLKNNNSTDSVLDASAPITNILYDSYSTYYISREAKFTKKDNILDFGCGLGRLSFAFANQVNSVTGVDISPELIDVANSKIGANQNITFKRTAPGELLTGKFTKIVFFGVILHIDNDGINQVLKNFNEILETGGKIIFIEPVYKKEELQGGVVLYRTHDTLVKLFDQAGFKLLKSQNVLRSPSFSFNLLKKLKIRNKLALSFYRKVEEMTINRKPQFADFFWELYVFEKK